jgi:hypothetical protein
MIYIYIKLFIYKYDIYIWHIRLKNHPQNGRRTCLWHPPPLLHLTARATPRHRHHRRRSLVIAWRCGAEAFELLI